MRRFVLMLAMQLAGTFNSLLAQPDDSGASAASATDKPVFDVWEYRVLGVDVLESRAVEHAIYEYLGPEKTIDDVELARSALEQAYRDAGYNTVFVDIPEQSVDDGIVRLRVTEGALDRIRVSGARYFSNRQILARLPSLKQGEVPQFEELQSELAALNRQTPDRAVTPILRAGRFPGTVDIELRVDDSTPIHGGIEVNDRYSVDTTELRASLNLSYNNLWQKAHGFTFNYQTAPEERDEAEVFAATYIARFPERRSIVALYAVDSSSDVATVGTLSVIGNGNIFGIRGIQPFDNVGNFFHNATVGVDFKKFDEGVRLTPADEPLTGIRYINWSANYAFGWNRPRSSSDFSIGASWGLRGIGNDDLEFADKRFNARGNYAYLTGSASHTQQIAGDLRFVTRLNWQYSNQPLINNEQFNVGGVSSVRGYLESERLGDLGAAASLELHTPPLLRSQQRVDDMRIFLFYDAAELRIRDPLPAQLERARLESTGIGFRFLGLGGLSLELEWAKALKDGANVLKDEQRSHFMFSYTF